MHDIEIIRQALAGKTTAQLQTIAARVKDLPWETLYKVATGRTANPTIGTVEKIKEAIGRG